MGNDPVYNKSKCFEAFQFPDVKPALKARIRDLAEQLDAHRKRQQTQHADLTLTGMYNVLEKLKTGATLNAKEKVIHEHGLVAVLKTLHDELDRAVLEAYGWSDLAPLLADIGGLIRRVLGGSIALESELSEPALAVRSNRAALEMALLNLAANARDAMPEGGKLGIFGHPSQTPGCIDLDIVDNGSGMPEAVAARALDPFFTTKEIGKGTGLGLAQVHSLMLQSHGSIEIESTAGVGTTIRLVFPKHGTDIDLKR